MSTPLAGAIAFGAESAVTGSDRFSHLQTQREQLTVVLRMLAAELDALDRRLSDIEWCQRRESPGVSDDVRSERSTLEAQRGQLTSRLRVLARDLNDIDVALASCKGYAAAPAHAPRVGTCPDCGYPSLDSGLCAFCRPRLAH